MRWVGYKKEQSVYRNGTNPAGQARSRCSWDEGDESEELRREGKQGTRRALGHKICKTFSLKGVKDTYTILSCLAFRLLSCGIQPPRRSVSRVRSFFARSLPSPRKSASLKDRVGEVAGRLMCCQRSKRSVWFVSLWGALLGALWFGRSSLCLSLVILPLDLPPQTDGWKASHSQLLSSPLPQSTRQRTHA